MDNTMVIQLQKSALCHVQIHLTFQIQQQDNVQLYVHKILHWVLQSGTSIMIQLIKHVLLHVLILNHTLILQIQLAMIFVQEQSSKMIEQWNVLLIVHPVDQFLFLDIRENVLKNALGLTTGPISILTNALHHVQLMPVVISIFRTTQLKEISV